MSIFSDIAKVGVKIEDFLGFVSEGAKKLQAIYSALSGPTLAAGAAVFYDVVKAVASGESAASAAASGNVVQAVTLSETTLSLVKTVVADFKAGEKTVVSDFEALGIKL